MENVDQSNRSRMEGLWMDSESKDRREEVDRQREDKRDSDDSESHSNRHHSDAQDTLLLFNDLTELPDLRDVLPDLIRQRKTDRVLNLHELLQLDHSSTSENLLDEVQSLNLF